MKKQRSALLSTAFSQRPSSSKRHLALAMLILAAFLSILSCQLAGQVGLEAPAAQEALSDIERTSTALAELGTQIAEMPTRQAETQLAAEAFSRQQTNVAATQQASGFAALTATRAAQNNAEATRNVSTTSTARALITPTLNPLRSTETALKSLAPLQAISLVYGPEDGELTHMDNSVAKITLASGLRDFALMVRVFNPYSVTAHAWDFGVLFRDVGSNEEFRLKIRSDRSWELTDNRKSAKGSTVRSGSVKQLNTKENEDNLFLLICIGERGWFYINDQLVSELNLKSRMNAGDTAFGVGFDTKYKRTGDVTRYQRLTLWNVK